MYTNDRSIFELTNECIPHLMKGASTEQINTQESVLKCAFPSDYIDFLQYTNGGEVYDGEITLFSIYDPSTKINIRNTIGFVNRTEMSNALLPSSYLIIGEYNFGDIIAVDKNSGCVIQWSHEYNNVFLSYDSFKEFLKSIVEEHHAYES